MAKLLADSIDIPSTPQKLLMSALSPPNAQAIIELDPYLAPFSRDIERRQVIAQDWLTRLDRDEGGLLRFSKGYEYYGFTRESSTEEIVYREWVPNATGAFLTGDFAGWQRPGHSLRRINDYGVWEIRLPAGSIEHGSKVKLVLILPGGEMVERVPAWSRRVVQDRSIGTNYDAQFWSPPKEYVFRYPRPNKDLTKGGIKVYEAHIGISTPEPRIGTYREFRENVLPHIADLGYNCIQLMAIMEHAYYGSFGYQITNFFAVSSRFGTPEELMELVDTAHGLGITVLLDVVHSHASKNTLDGLNYFDGTDYQYFHGGGKGYHEQWDSRLFNYGKHEVLRFLLSNLRFFLDVYHFDGFRFDGVTSMLYVHHGVGTGFSGGYHEYFGSSGNVDEQAVTYLILANYLIKSLSPKYIAIAEDVSGMPTLCLPTAIGGVGFDYRLGMAIPDMWIKMLKEQSDDEWDMGHVAYILTNRRHKELTIAYAESHDQALVGDKTLAFWLMDKLMYTHMSILSPETIEVTRGIALHKMIRFVTHALGGEGYLNFEGNEFGHPEWLDFPREGNQESYHYARRQFNLIEDKLLLFQFLNNFDRALQRTEDRYKWLQAPQAYVSLKRNDDKMLGFDRAGVLFVFNFHPTKSYTDYRVGVSAPGPYKVVLSTDDSEFKGHNRVDKSTEHHTTPEEWNGRPYWIQIYIPCRTAIAFAAY